MLTSSKYPGNQPFNLDIKPTGRGKARTGKTQRDKSLGNKAQNRMNVQARGDWSRDGGSFPSGTCNGKKTQALRNRTTKRGSRK